MSVTLSYCPAKVLLEALNRVSRFANCLIIASELARVLVHAWSELTFMARVDLNVVWLTSVVLVGSLHKLALLSLVQV